MTCMSVALLLLLVLHDSMHTETKKQHILNENTIFAFTYIHMCILYCCKNSPSNCLHALKLNFGGIKIGRAVDADTDALFDIFSLLLLICFTEMDMIFFNTFPFSVFSVDDAVVCIDCNKFPFCSFVLTTSQGNVIGVSE